MRLLTLVALLIAAPAAAAEPVAGTWLTDTKDGWIEIAPCGAKMCGRLVKNTRPISGPPFDRNNPDPALRGRPLIGLPVLLDFMPDGNAWRGTGYDPKNGKSYSTSMERTGPGTLKIRGCVFGFICRSAIWTRVQ